MYCINTNLTINLLTFNKYILCNLLYMIITYYQNKWLYNILFSRNFLDINFMDFLKDFAHKQNSVSQDS